VQYRCEHDAAQYRGARDWQERRERQQEDRGRADREDEAAPLFGGELVFTSGGTEANNLAIHGVLEARPERRHVVTSTIEHPAVAALCAWAERNGWRVTRCGVDAEGRVRPADVSAALDHQGTALVTVMHANNETGVLQPVRDLAEAARSRDAVMHTDAAQSVGKVEVDVRRLGVDLLTVAGHKLYAPKGVGALYVRRGTPIRPFALGAGHERGLRPGTENVASIVGLGAAAERARLELAAESGRLRALRDDLWERLRVGVPGLALNGHTIDRLPNTLSVRFPNVTGAAVLAGAPAVAASTGSACHDGIETAPAVIVAMGVPAEAAVGTIRLSLGRSTTTADVEAAARALTGAWRTASDR
jgi:cysteine desulfurase